MNTLSILVSLPKWIIPINDRENFITGGKTNYDCSIHTAIYTSVTDLEYAKTIVQNRWLNPMNDKDNIPLHYRLKSVLKRVLWRKCFVEAPDFDITKHIEQIDLEDYNIPKSKRPYSIEDMKNFMNILIGTNFDKTKPLWNIRIIQNCLNFDGNISTLWFVSFHHSLTDGVSCINSLFNELIDERIPLNYEELQRKKTELVRRKPIWNPTIILRPKSSFIEKYILTPLLFLAIAKNVIRSIFWKAPPVWENKKNTKNILKYERHICTPILWNLDSINYIRKSPKITEQLGEKLSINNLLICIFTRALAKFSNFQKNEKLNFTFPISLHEQLPESFSNVYTDGVFTVEVPKYEDFIYKSNIFSSSTTTSSKLLDENESMVEKSPEIYASYDDTYDYKIPVNNLSFISVLYNRLTCVLGNHIIQMLNFFTSLYNEKFTEKAIKKVKYLIHFIKPKSKTIDYISPLLYPVVTFKKYQSLIDIQAFVQFMLNIVKLPIFMSHLILDDSTKNLTALITNVPGPTELLGADNVNVDQVYFAAPIRSYLGLGFAAVSYNNVMYITVISDKGYISNIDRLSQCITEVIHEFEIYTNYNVTKIEINKNNEFDYIDENCSQINTLNISQSKYLIKNQSITESHTSQSSSSKDVKLLPPKNGATKSRSSRKNKK